MPGPQVKVFIPEAQHAAAASVVRGRLTPAADRNTAIPSGSGNFRFFSAFSSVSGNGVAFNGSDGTRQHGIYTSSVGAVTRVADVTTPLPSGTGNFTGFGSPSPHTHQRNERPFRWAQGPE